MQNGWIRWFVAAVMAALAVLVVVGIHQDWGRSDLAAWVQALGSIAAVIGAWLGTAAQLRHVTVSRNRERAEIDLAYAQACLLAAQDATAALDYVAGRLGEHQSGWVLVPTERIEDLQLTFRSLIGKDLPARHLSGMLVIQRELAYTLTALRQMKTNRGFVTPQRARNAANRARRVAGIQAQFAGLAGPQPATDDERDD